MKRQNQTTVPNVLKSLAEVLGTEVKNGRLEIPEKFGKGYCTGLVFNEHLRMIISNYELNEDLVIENQDIDSSKRMIVFKFQNIFTPAETTHTGKAFIEVPSVLIATSRLNTDKFITIHSNTAVINIEVDADYLKGLFEFLERSPILENLLQNTQPLLFEQIVFSSLMRIIDEILTEDFDKIFELFFLRIKAEELICRLLMELEKRKEKHLYALNNSDIQTIFKVKEQMLKNLEKPPVINELAVCANMSPSKLKRLFKQIFGNSIFSYYQEFRMKEAARLLREENLSVSEAGYSMGFTNLSHFTKIFEEHIGMKPKKYSTIK
jgi:AraC-like DNA-binding protein